MLKCSLVLLEGNIGNSDFCAKLFLLITQITPHRPSNAIESFVSQSKTFVMPKDSGYM